MKTMFTFLFLSSYLCVFSQEHTIYFEDALSEHLDSYNKQCDLALVNDHVEYVDVLFDSLKKTYLRGTLISNLRLKKISSGYINTDDIKTPILLITKKSCIVTNREEIKTINELANQYKGKLAFIVLYWDKKRLAKKATKGYNKNVTVVYVNERDNKLNLPLSGIKNSFGAPASFYITENKELSNIDRKFYLKNVKKSTRKTFIENTYKDISQLLLESETRQKETDISKSGNK